MKRLGILGLIAALLVLAALPALLGAVTEHRVRSRVESMQDGSLTATLLSFERGWFSSRARIELKLSPRYLAEIEALKQGSPPPADIAPDRTATIVVDFAHGPVAVRNGVFVGLSKMTARLDPATAGIGDLEQRLGVPYFFEFRGRTGFLGGTTFDADMPPIHLPLPDTALDFSGATLTGALRGRHLTSDLRLGSITFKTPSGAFGVHNLAGSIDSEIRSRYVVPGTLKLTLEHAVIADTSGGTPLFEIKNLETASNARLDRTGTELEMQMTSSLDRLQAEGMAFGNLRLGVALHHIDAAAMQSYLDNSVRLSAAPGSPERAEALAALSPVIARGLAAGPSLVLDPVRFTLNDEPFDARAELSVDPSQLPPASAFDLADPSLWLAVVKSNAMLKVSKLLARQIAVVTARMRLADSLDLPPEQLRSLAEAQAGLMLAALTGQGVLRSEGDDYVTELQVADGLLTVNGRALPLGLR